METINKGIIIKALSGFYYVEADGKAAVFVLIKSHPLWATGCCLSARGIREP